MPAARSTLEALVANDPENPAIRLFITSLEVTLSLTCNDATKIEAIQHLIQKLEKRMQQ